MQIINMSKTKLNSLEPLILPKNVTSTECEVNYLNILIMVKKNYLRNYIVLME